MHRYSPNSLYELISPHGRWFIKKLNQSATLYTTNLGSRLRFIAKDVNTLTVKMCIRDRVITAYQAASGWVNLITPTSGIVMGALAIAHVNISIWWKWMLKLMIYLFIVTCVFLGIAAVL